MFNEVLEAAQAVADHRTGKIAVIPVSTLENLLLSVASTNVLLAEVVDSILDPNPEDASCA